jgi:hypothetical protein
MEIKSRKKWQNDNYFWNCDLDLLNNGFSLSRVEIPFCKLLWTSTKDKNCLVHTWNWMNY